MQQQQLKTIKLDEIRPDPKQPRKHFDEEAINELAESIKENGVIQPVLVRPSGRGYMLVYGERRFRASKVAGKTSIPCTIRTLSDEEALELQLIENLQRKDPHPMEEAVAFKSYLGMKQLTIEEMAHKLGKQVFYIRQRLKLADLSAAWQKVFFMNLIKVGTALKVAQLPEQEQKLLYEEKVDEDEFEMAGYKIELYDSYFDRYKGDLNKAAFDINTTNLIKGVPACSNCKFNTAFASLFADDLLAPRCMNISCFNNKTNTSFTQKLEEATNDSTIVFLNDYYARKESKIVKELNKKDKKVLMPGKDASVIEEPEKPDWETYKDENENYESKEEMELNFQQELQDYDKAFKAYQQKISTGKYSKAFVVEGDNKGKTVFVELRKDELQTEKAKDPNDAIRQEVARIKVQEENAEEQDSIAVHGKLKASLKDHEPFTKNDGDLSLAEKIALVVSMFSYGHTNASGVFLTAFKVQPGQKMELYKALIKADPWKAHVIINKYLRMNVADMISMSNDSPLVSGSAAAIRNVANEYMPSIVGEIEKQQKAIITKRKAALEKKVAELEAGLTDLKVPGKKKGIKSLIN